MADIFTAILEVAKFFVAPFRRQFNYLCNYKSNLDTLKTEFQKLTDASEDVQRRTGDAERNGDEIKRNVKRWQDTVNKVIDEAGSFIQENDNAKNRCFNGSCPNLIARYSKSKEAWRKLEIVSEQLKEGEKFNEVSHPTKPAEIWLQFDKNFEDFESRRSTLKNILKAVKDDNVDMIGVYGMGGGGKTTLVQEVGRQAQKDKLFEEVVFVEVSDAPDILKIQEKIAGQLGLQYSSNVDVSQRANQLYGRLRNKKFLMILDNIWKEVDLKTVGIHAVEDHKGSKLLLTTRDLDVLERMGSKPFHLRFLNDDESWRLFKKMAGNYIENPELKSIAMDLVKECGGLPIALVTVGKALRNKKIYEWKDALRELRRPTPTNIAGSVLEEAYSKINLSFNCLKTEELKRLFLLCSLLEYHPRVFDLFRYVIGLDILEGDIRTMEEARNRIEKLVRELKDSCLLLDYSGPNGLLRPFGYGTSERFSMHDVVRAVAISIACRDQHVFMRRNDGRRQWPSKENQKECQKICLINSNFGEPCEGLECLKVEFFYVRKYSAFKIPVNFFTGMANLRVLDFPRMELISSPLPLRLPVNLQTLCLEYSGFEDIALIGKLKQLKILSLRNSHNLTQLPMEIGELIQLRLLDLTWCGRLEVIAPKVISRLVRLEELYMRGCNVKWEVEELSVERSNATLDELKHLSQLTTLELDIEDEKILPNRLFSKQLERFHISIGSPYREYWSTYSYVGLRKLYLNLDSTICSEELQILNNVEFLYIARFPGANKVLYKIVGEGFPKLKGLDVFQNPDALCIADSITSVARDAFPLPLLELMILEEVSNLEKVFDGLLTVDFFCNLKVIKVSYCDKLKNIFSLSNSRCLPLLERIDVGSCKSMKKIFAIGNDDNILNNNAAIDKIGFNQLRFLDLYSLPELTSFCSKLMTPSTSQKRHKSTNEVQSSDIISEYELDTPTALFNRKVVFPSLEDLKLQDINSEIIWHNFVPTTSSNYRNLTSLKVDGCQKIKYVFPASIITSFVQLQKLEIEDCIALTEIVGKEGGDEEVAPTFVFPRVDDLWLRNLPKLASFYPRKHTSKWPELKRLKVSDCDNVKMFTSKYLNSNEKNEQGQSDSSTLLSLFFIEEINPNFEELNLCEKNIPVDMLERFCNLQILRLYLCANKELFLCGEEEKHVRTLTQIKELTLEELFDLEKLWKQDSRLDLILQNLEDLHVNSCHNLVTLMPTSTSFQNLTVLRVWCCYGLMNMVTYSTAKSFERLREMDIRHCTMMIEMVETEENEERDAICFNKLKKLVLMGLESLTSFCSGNYSFDFPSLDELTVEECPKMKIFTGGVLNTPILQHIRLKEYGFEYEECWGGDLNITIQQLHQKKVYSNLEELTVSGMEIMMICQGQSPVEHRFDGVKVLEIIKDESTSIPVGILQRFNNLEKLILKASSYEKVLFSCGKGGENSEMLTQIKVLELWRLFNLKYIWKEDSKSYSICQNLEILSANYCHSLMSLVPSSASFENLTTLDVWYCNGLINLVTSSVAKSLVRLKRMKIQHCEMMQDIVANDMDVVKDEIVFGELEELFLDHLKNLTSFCPGNYTFKFPNLQEVTIENCPKMKCFSQGVLSMSKLQKVKQYRWDKKGFWKGDINTTIQQLHKIVSETI